MDTNNDTICVLCNEQLDSGETVTLREKGVKGLEKAAEERAETLYVKPGQKVHTNCRKQYTSPHVLSIKRKERSEQNEKVSLRSGASFSFKDDCLFCGKSINETCRQRLYMDYYKVRTKDFQNEIHAKAKERNDEWGNEILARIEFSRDLHASDALYHQVCSVNFRKCRDKPSENYGTKKRRTSCGRTKSTSREEAFLKVIHYLEENDDEQITIQTLVDKMEEFLGGKDSFTPKYMKIRLLEYFGDEIVITTVQKKDNVVTFRGKASNILHNFYKLPKYDDPEREKMKIIEAASKLIKSDIKGLSASREIYPGSADMTSPQKGVEFLPDSLKLFLSDVFVGKCTEIKVAAVGQAIMQAARPRVLITPLQLGLGVQLHHHFGSRYLIETLYNLGFCCSYKEVQRFEQSAALTNNTEIPGYIPGQFVQYVADNVDHNIQTIDGRDTFHGMGIIAAVTPCVKSNREIPRLKVTARELEEIGKISIHFYSLKQCTNITYEPLDDLIAEDNTYDIDILWKTTWLLKDDRTSWNGTMQMINSKCEYPGQSSVVFMPMIDLNPSDETCIYSTLVWISEHAKRYNVTPVITFDQPLWYKANQIITSEPTESDVRNIVVRLGGFHTEMSFLGAIGYIMSDSGLNEVLSVIYAEKAVSHMLSGKAISRALRGHGLVHMALQSLIVAEVFGLDIISDKQEDSQECVDSGKCEEAEQITVQGSENQDEESEEVEHNVAEVDLTAQKTDIDVRDVGYMSVEINNDQVLDNIEMCVEEETDTTEQNINIDLQCALELFDSVLTGDISIEMACQAQVKQRILERMNAYCDKVRQDSRTARLWLQYLEMVELLRNFIKAERMGNWQLHLATLKQMLPYFTATGHNLYAKSAYLYLTNMQRLPQTNPELYAFFMNGYHVIRRSDRYWAGLSTDLVIEQMLMRSIKSVGGLTRGRGMTDVQRAIWILSRPATSDINEAMQTFCGTIYTTSEQHKETNTATQKRDRKDTEIIMEYLYERNPFKSEPDLKSITSGVVSHASDADLAREIGQKVVLKMVGKTVNEFTFKKKDTVVQMNDKAGIKIDGETVKLDPQLLFQRLISAANRSTEETQLPQLFSYELCTHPPALFETPRLMRAADKPALANAMKSKDNPGVQQTIASEEKCHVIDGGMLLQWLPWECGQTYGEICESYIRFVESKFTNATVVFDGYEGGPNTKDNTHGRRNTGIVGTEVRFNESTKFRGKKKTFLTNSKNKQAFIKLLSNKMNIAEIETSHAVGDADLLIVLTAVRCSLSRHTVLVGDDTDLLVLLCYHASHMSLPIVFHPRPKPHRETLSWDIHKLQTHLGEDVCQNILFIHAILGCDTTSKVYGFGKGVGLKLFDKCESFRNAASVFNMSPAIVSKESVILSGEQALVCLYKGATGQHLNSVRLSSFVEKVAKTSMFIDPKQLPPTSDAAKFHSLRVFLQIQEWKGENVLDPLEWGWENVDNKFYPITTDRAPAPAHIIKVVHCTCQTGCKTLACSCRKVGLECSSACSTCKGLSCENAFQPELETD